MYQPTLSTAKILTAGAIIAGLLAIASVLAFGGAHQTARASGQSIVCLGDNVVGSITPNLLFANTCSPRATTTPQYLGNGITGATTTVGVYNTSNTSSLSLNIDVVASSTTSVILTLVQFSNDGINWYRAATNSTTAGLTTVSQQLYQFTPGTTSTTTINLSIGSIGSKYTRILMSGNVASSSVSVQGIGSQLIPN